ncbi:glycogen debranching N-terminal domain-containing protein [Paraburkholderia phenoliruptrix]|uniref:glycogen debranching N-terminal domain-containing protein n=1 Tax=Paraburkholderia phenoliruptrix TaxID=252970 RepID=UPI002869E8FF|nr:glycogen debranching N-terminal domain-containing protein [Paraburkholderia phenoliruptrix]
MRHRLRSGGLHEDLDLTNYGRSTVRINLEIAPRSDFADIFEVKSGTMIRRGRIATDWSQHQQRLTTMDRNRDFIAVVRGPVRTRQPHRLAADGARPSRLRARGAGCAWLRAGDGTRRLSRR